MELKELIERKRGKRNLRELAIELGVSHQTLYNAMNGKGNPSYKLLSALGLIRLRRQVETSKP
jgi:DNA-binding phage protein